MQLSNRYTYIPLTFTNFSKMLQDTHQQLHGNGTKHQQVALLQAFSCPFQDAVPLLPG